MVWLVTLIFTVTTGEEQIVKHATLVSRENTQLQEINFLPTLSSSYSNGIVIVFMPTVALLHIVMHRHVARQRPRNKQ
jgi:hypothetical protein